MTVVLYNYNAAGGYTWVGDTGVTSTAATEAYISSNPMLVHVGRMMTRAAVPLLVWESVKDGYPLF